MFLSRIVETLGQLLEHFVLVVLVSIALIASDVKTTHKFSYSLAFVASGLTTSLLVQNVDIDTGYGPFIVAIGTITGPATLMYWKKRTAPQVIRELKDALDPPDTKGD